MEDVYREIIAIKAEIEEIEAKYQHKLKEKEEEEMMENQMIKGESEDGDFEMPDQNANDKGNNLHFEQSGGMEEIDNDDDLRRDTLMMASGRSADSIGAMQANGKSLLDDTVKSRSI